MVYIFPALISLALGLLTLYAILKDRMPPPLLVFFWAATLGLGESAFFTFTSFLFFNQLIPVFVISLNLAIIAGLVFFLKKTGQLNMLSQSSAFNLKDDGPLFALILLVLPVFLFASLYPYGGWDAWGCWNTKARFLFLGGTSWTNMFDPALRRTQILYPFLLPLINVWFWSFGKIATYAVPMAMTCIIPFLTGGVLYSSLKEYTGRSRTILVPVWIFSNTFVITLASSQYSDLLLGLLLLSSFSLFLSFQKKQDPAFLIVMGIMLGLMGFTKVEGAALCAVVLFASLALIATDRSLKTIRAKACLRLAAATAIASLPAVIYYLVFAPKNSGIFINGFTSSEHPVSLERLLTIFNMTAREFIDAKWNGIWIALAAILLFSWGKSIRRELRLIPIVLSAYVLIFLMTYLTNTYYDIVWWLNTSLNRVIFAFLPSAALWAFLAMDESKNT